METGENREREIRLLDLFWNILFEWRIILCVGIMLAVLISGVKYIKDSKAYRIAQNSNTEQEFIELTTEEQEKIEEAKELITRIEKYQDYLGSSALMQIDPYNKSLIELQYYVESDYVYNYTRDNLSDYTSDLMSLYYNYLRSGEMSDKIINDTDLSISQADFSELCSVVQYGKTMKVSISCARKDDLEKISNYIKLELSKKEMDFQEVGSHKLKLLSESKNVIVDSDLAEKKNTVYNNITSIDTQLSALKSSMSEQQLKKLRMATGLEDDDKKEEVAEPSFSFKYMVLGGIFGIMLMCVYIACKMVFSARLQNSDEICNLYNVRLLGEIAITPKKKRFLSIIDEKLLKIKNRRQRNLSSEQQIKNVSTNITLFCKNQKITQVYMTGSEYENADTLILDRLREEFLGQGIQIEEGGSIVYDAESLKQGTEIGNILFIEQLGRSMYNEIYNELNLAKEQKNYVLGVIVLI